MTVYLTRSSGRITLTLRAEGDDTIGDAQFDVLPGRVVFGRSYDEWASLPDGPYEVS